MNDKSKTLSIFLCFFYSVVLIPLLLNTIPEYPSVLFFNLFYLGVILHAIACEFLWFYGLVKLLTRD